MKKLLKNDKNITSKHSLIKYHIFLFCLFLISYIVIANQYSYMETRFTLSFNAWRFLIGITIFSLILFLLSKVKNEQQRFIFNLVTILIAYGEIICFIYNKDTNPATLIGSLILLLFLLLSQNIGFKTKKQKRPSRNPFPILLLLSIILFIPYIVLFHDKINLNNLLLNDVYETRMAFRGNIPAIIGYFMAPLSRIILPTLAIMSIRDKKYGHLIICIVMILYLFLCGALKSTFFGMIAALVLYKGGYDSKIKRILCILIIATLIGLVLVALFKNEFIISLIRRVFFVPARLNSLYANYFYDKPTFLGHSPLGLGLTENLYGSSLSLYFGEIIMGTPGLNANVGLLIEGFVSFNIIGVILFALIMCIVLNYFRWIKVNPIYAGIIFTYVYYMNTSFLSVLLLTHGLAFLFIFSYFFMRDNYKEKENAY